MATSAWRAAPTGWHAASAGGTRVVVTRAVWRLLMLSGAAVAAYALFGLLEEPASAAARDALPRSTAAAAPSWSTSSGSVSPDPARSSDTTRSSSGATSSSPARSAGARSSDAARPSAAVRSSDAVRSATALGRRIVAAGRTGKAVAGAVLPRARDLARSAPRRVLSVADPVRATPRGDSDDGRRRPPAGRGAATSDGHRHRLDAGRRGAADGPTRGAAGAARALDLPAASPLVGPVDAPTAVDMSRVRLATDASSVALLTAKVRGAMPLDVPSVDDLLPPDRPGIDLPIDVLTAILDPPAIRGLGVGVRYATARHPLPHRARDGTGPAGPAAGPDMTPRSTEAGRGADPPGRGRGHPSPGAPPRRTPAPLPLPVAPTVVPHGSYHHGPSSHDGGAAVTAAAPPLTAPTGRPAGAAGDAVLRGRSINPVPLPG